MFEKKIKERMFSSTLWKRSHISNVYKRW